MKPGRRRPSAAGNISRLKAIGIATSNPQIDSKTAGSTLDFDTMVITLL